MAGEKIVVDASVIVKWFVDEEGSSDALKLREDHIANTTTIVVPDLVFLEVLNAVRYKGATPAKLAEVNRALWDIQLQQEHHRSFLLEKACTIAFERTLSLYDALYLALAQLHGVPLVTADSALARNTNVILIGNSGKRTKR